MRKLLAFVFSLISSSAFAQGVSTVQPSVVVDQRSQHGAATLTLSASDRYVVTCNKVDTACSSGTWNTAATWTLPNQVTIIDGRTIAIADDAGVVTNTNTLSIAPFSGSTINGSASAIVINASRGKINCQSNLATLNWTCNGSIPNGGAGQVLIAQGANPANWTTISGAFTLNNTGTATASSIPTTALTGQVDKAHGGTNSTTGKGAASTLSIPYIVCAPTLTSVTGTTNETVIGSCTIPANLIGTTGILNYFFTNSLNSSSNNRTLRVRYGAANDISGTSCLQTTVASSSTAVGQGIFGYILGNGATNTNVCITPTGFTGTYLNTTQQVSTNIDTTAISYLNATGQLGNTGDTMTGLAFVVVFYPTGGN